MSETKSGRGGRREGAGRKKTTSKSIALRIPEDVEAVLEGVKGSKSAFIVAAIRAYVAAGCPGHEAEAPEA